MVKGISRQVIVVHSPDPQLFEQAIFILKDDALDRAEVTDEVLLNEAKKLIRSDNIGNKRVILPYGPVWACAGALVTAAVWLISGML